VGRRNSPDSSFCSSGSRSAASVGGLVGVRDYSFDERASLLGEIGGELFWWQRNFVAGNVVPICARHLRAG